MVRLNKSLNDNTKDVFKKYNNSIEPQEGLVPVNNSPFYMTPSEPADPMDCNRYPDSPWCGGNPIDLRPVALDIEIIRDECNFGVQFSGTLGFIKIPPFQIVYRNPACNPPPDNPERENEPGTSPFIPPPTARGIYFFYSSGRSFYKSKNRYTGEIRVELECVWNYSSPSGVYPLGDRFPNFFRGDFSVTNEGFERLVDNEREEDGLPIWM